MASLSVNDTNCNYQELIDYKITNIQKNALFIEDLSRIGCCSDSDIAELARLIVLDSRDLMAIPHPEAAEALSRFNGFLDKNSD